MADSSDAEENGTDHTTERLKAVLWLAIGKIVDDEALKRGTNASSVFIGKLTELVWGQIENLSHDLERFALHAGRSIIKAEDVFLVARRNKSLEDLLRGAIPGAYGESEG